MLQQIASGVKTKMLRRRLVAPFDAALRIEQHHAIGRGLHRRQNLVKPRLAFQAVAVLGLEQAMHALGNVAPHARQGGR